MLTIPPSQGATRRRWRVGVALSLSVTLAFVGTPLASAATDTPAPDDEQVTSAASAPRVVEFPMSGLLWTDHFWRYGSDESPLSIGPSTRALVLDVDLEPLGPVICEFAHPEDFEPTAKAQWPAEQWSSDAPKILAIPESTGTRFVSCKSGAVDQPNWHIQWRLRSQAEDGRTEVVLTDDAKYLTESGDTNEYNSPRAAKAVEAGDIVRIVGAPGTWPVEQVRVELFGGGSKQAPVTLFPDGAVSADGSTVEFTVVPEHSPDRFGPNASFRVTSSSSAVGPPLHSEMTSFRAPLVYGGEASADVAVTLSSRYALSFQRVTATAVIKPAGVPMSTGTVSFSVNRTSVGTAPLGSNDKAVFRLPALARGTYAITATFTPATGSPASVSPGAWLRVLR